MFFNDCTANTSTKHPKKSANVMGKTEKTNTIGPF